MFSLVIRNSSNKRRIGGAALIQGRRLLTFLFQMRRLIEGGAYSSKYGIWSFYPTNVVGSYLFDNIRNLEGTSVCRGTMMPFHMADRAERTFCSTYQ